MVLILYIKLVYEHMIDFAIKIELKVFLIYAHISKNIILSKLDDL